MSTLERLREHKARRLGYYRDLICEAGACDNNGQQFTDGDLKSLFGVAAELNMSERAVADDLTAATRWHALSTQVARAEDVKPQAEKSIAKTEKQIADARAQQKQLGSVTHGGQHDKEHQALASELTTLQQQHREARKPIGRAEVAAKQLDELRVRCPWLKGAQ